MFHLPRPALLSGLLLVSLSCWAIPLQAGWQPPVVVEVRGPDGAPLTTGKVVLCPGEGPCVDFPLSSSGEARLDSGLLLGSDLTIVVHDERNGRRLVASGWNLTRAQRWDVENRPASVRGVLRGTADLGLQLTFDHDEAAAPRMGRKPSRWYVAGGAVLLEGEHFRSSSTALGHGLDVETGFAAQLGHRFGIPRGWTDAQGAQSYLDFTVSYAQNRYRLGADPEFGSRDLIFHRISVGLGPGWSWDHTRLSLQAQLGMGFVLDGTAVLERLDRRYSMPAAGLSARFSRLLFGVGLGRLGLCVEGSALYFMDEELADDHWYGLAPAVMLGLTLD